ncbi:protein FAM81B [Archocentrus centrarchus]|uniref:protein FAM81B n=1 Tax=Archocentrus centrarchus TaxID=63155 RepID=UPI0011E9E059|nr:protein FAM81B [Archocentrus centrarchus]
MSYESQLQSHTRPDDWEGRLRSQDRTLAVLLEQALRIKAEVAAGLQSNHGSVQTKSLSRKLLERHILIIPRIVKQLSMRMQALENEMAQRDSVTSGMALVVQNLDQKNTVGIGDLRGRVARCDSNIAKLSADVSSGEQQVIRLQWEVQELRKAVNGELKELEDKIHNDLKRLEASLTKDSKDQKRLMSDLHRQVKLLEERMSGELEEGKEQIEKLRKWTEQQLTHSFQSHAEDNQEQVSLLQDKMFELVSRLTDRQLALEARAEKFDTQWNEADCTHYDQLKRSEGKLSRRITSVENRLHQKLQLLKQEYHKGFLSVHDAIESLRQICDIKSRLDKEKLQKDIRHICSKVTELKC